MRNDFDLVCFGSENSVLTSLAFSWNSKQLAYRNDDDDDDDNRRKLVVCTFLTRDILTVHGLMWMEMRCNVIRNNKKNNGSIVYEMSI